MPYRIWQEWIAYSEVEPFGEWRADLRAGIIASTIANCLSRKKGRPAFKPSQFMPEFKRQGWPTVEELLKKVKWVNWLFGGKVEKS